MTEGIYTLRGGIYTVSAGDIYSIRRRYIPDPEGIYTRSGGDIYPIRRVDIPDPEGIYTRSGGDIPDPEWIYPIYTQKIPDPKGIYTLDFGYVLYAHLPPLLNIPKKYPKNTLNIPSNPVCMSRSPI